MVWIRERSERRKPSLSASRIATSDTSGNVQPFAQQVDAHQHVELSQPQIPDDFHSLHGVDVGVQITHLDAVFRKIVGQVLRHALGKRGHQHAFIALHPVADLGQQVVHLGGGRPHLYLRVHQSGRSHHLLHHLRLVLAFILRGRGGNEKSLRHDLLELVEPERPVVECAREPKAVVHQILLARAVAAIHAADLRER